MTPERLAEIERHLETFYVTYKDLEDCVAYIYQLLAIIARLNGEAPDQIGCETPSNEYVWGQYPPGPGIKRIPDGEG